MSQFNTQGEPRSGDSSSYDMKPDRTPYELVVMENNDLRARLQLADERAFEQAATIARLRVRGDQALRTLQHALLWMESFKRHASIGDNGPLSYSITETKQLLAQYKQT